MPLPLGINVARRDLGDETLHELSEVLRESIRAGLENREEAMQYAMQFGRGIDERVADRFVGMYVNELTEDYGDEGRARGRGAARSRRGAGRLRAARADQLRLVTMRRAVVLSAVRTPIGRYGGALAGVRPDDLAARRRSQRLWNAPA